MHHNSSVRKAAFNKILIVVLHLCGWALLFLLPLRIISRGPALFDRRIFRVLTPPAKDVTLASIPFNTTYLVTETLITNGLLVLFFYANMFIMIPRVLSGKGWRYYLLWVVLAFAVYLFVGYILRVNYAPFPRHFRPALFVNIPNFLMVFGISLALRLMQDRSDYETLLKEQENEKLKAELAFLRSQVSPHFMFNVLNSLASLARKKSDRLEYAIIQLSQLMRYTLYNTNNKVSLEQEADYINSYINLQRLRFGSVVNMHFHVNIQVTDIRIEPMVLVPFVENAFKHGVGLIKNPIIIILLEATPNGINFVVRNKFNPLNDEVKDDSSGIGLQNVRRRLDLLYRDLYSLKTYTNDEDWFITELKIVLE